MKYSLWCFLFGHSWIFYEIKYGEPIGGVRKTIIACPVNYCVRCGLSKKEAGL